MPAECRQYSDVTIAGCQTTQRNAQMFSISLFHKVSCANSRVAKNVLSLNTIAINEFGGTTQPCMTLVVESPSFSDKE